MNDLKLINNQMLLMRSCQAELIRQRERANYWINVFDEQVNLLSEFAKAKEVEKNNLAQEYNQKKERVDNRPTEKSIQNARDQFIARQELIKNNKVNLLLEELFKTLEGK